MSDSKLPHLQVIIGSTRPGRVGKAVAEWVQAEAEAHGGFEVELVDLADIALPLLDEPHHTRGSASVGLVSYGGVAAGIRAVQALKPVLAAVKAVPLTESVNIPFVTQFLQDGQFIPNDTLSGSTKTMLDELVRWTGALQTLGTAV